MLKDGTITGALQHFFSVNYYLTSKMPSGDVGIIRSLLSSISYVNKYSYENTVI